ncbi:hypothetical protein J6590_008501 [Homalodisca vitripennis]|nr:hypothetical protein J6590_008501 [Homalodisca vitripennis]
MEGGYRSLRYGLEWRRNEGKYFSEIGRQRQEGERGAVFAGSADKAGRGQVMEEPTHINPPLSDWIPSFSLTDWTECSRK